MDSNELRAKPTRRQKEIKELSIVEIENEDRNKKIFKVENDTVCHFVTILNPYLVCDASGRHKQLLLTNSHY